MTSTPAVTLRSPGEIAALVPHLTGFVPHESLVAISMRGRRQRVGLTMRVDLTDDPALVGHVVRALVADQARACLLVVLTAAPSEAGHPWAGLVDDLQGALARSGVPVREALLVRDERWWSYRCSQACCPAEGTALDPDSAVVRAAASEHVFQGRAVLASRAELLASVQPHLPLGAGLVRQAQSQARRDLDERRAVDPVRAQDRELERWRGALDDWERRPATPPAPEVAALAIGLSLVAVRDTVASWALDRSDALLGLLGQLCRAVVDPDDAPVCTLLAWAAYARGDGALALVAVQRALATDPGYALAVLLLQALDAMLAPESVRGLLRRPA